MLRRSRTFVCAVLVLSLVALCNILPRNFVSNEATLDSYIFQEKYLNAETAANTQAVNVGCRSCLNEGDFSELPKHEIAAKKLIIFTNKRSGSSFVGEMFNRNRNAFYMFEPLLPFTRECNVLVDERVDTLRKCVRCDLDQLEEDYVKAFKTTGHSTKDCLNCGVCFYNRYLAIIRRYRKIAENRNGFLPQQECPYQLDMNIVSQMCRDASIDAYKILRVCSMQTLENLYANVIYQEPNLYDRIGLLHLIRDPRAIISSRLLLPDDEAQHQSLSYVAHGLCARLEQNILYANVMWNADGQPLHRNVLGVRYLRARYEDIATTPHIAAEAIYRYFGHEISPDVTSWISFAIRVKSNDSDSSPYSTKQNIDNALHGWRSHLSIKQVTIIQMQCANVMKMMGYKLIHDENELNHIPQRLW